MPPENLRKTLPRRFSEEAKTAIYGNAMLSLMTDTMTIQDIALVGMVDDEFRNQDILIAGDKLTTRIEVERLRWRGIHVRLTDQDTGEVFEPTECPELEMLTTAEAEAFTAEFLRHRGERGATRQEIEQVVKHADDLKLKHHATLLIQQGRVRLDVVNGEIGYVVAREELEAAKLNA